jgi:aryl-alcohol dehydrogenase-like predicted oxidoreductase
MQTMRLGRAGCEVSRLSLGSWRTYERISRDQALAVMREARDAGITFLDDARYNDETGTAPIPTGYSEVVFGELFRAAGWPRDETVVSNKLWWEFWPEQTPAQELDASLARMQLDHVDLIYTEQPPQGMELEDFVAAVTALIDAGKARFWGVLNYPADLVRRIGEVAERGGHPPMVANQLPYSLVDRSHVEEGGMVEAMASAGASVVASFVLAGGVLSGKYDLDPAAGRAAGSLDDPRLAPAVVAARQLRQLADELGTDGSTLAIAFALLHDSVATVLFGATKAEQVRRNVAALDLLHRLDDAAVRRLRAVGAG